MQTRLTEEDLCPSKAHTLKITNFWIILVLQTWVDRFRVWMASEVLKKLLAASDSVHTVITAYMSHSMHEPLYALSYCAWAIACMSHSKHEP